ncbi:MAG: hypothetical protein D6688_04930 [Alphaproteobacteria bacterium]|nr:MAG: hypothetical protein D6688_04930 [Alphaproteobacteria bacterium]
MLRAPALATLLAAVAACAPTIGGDAGALSSDVRRAPWPRLLPLSELTGSDAGAAATTPADKLGTTLAARAAALRREARRLSARPVLSPDERARLLAAIRRHGG